jgi:hypothetical protein
MDNGQNLTIFCTKGRHFSIQIYNDAESKKKEINVMKISKLRKLE